MAPGPDQKRAGEPGTLRLNTTVVLASEWRQLFGSGLKPGSSITGGDGRWRRSRWPRRRCGRIGHSGIAGVDVESVLKRPNMFSISFRHSFGRRAGSGAYLPKVRET